MTSTDPSMPPIPRELTIIVAATNKMGIGLGGTLPWTGLKKEMAYFARVTKRASPGSVNSVIMGRKTWDSIPAKFRPLKGRNNIVVSRSPTTDSSEEGKTSTSSLQGAIGEVKGEGRAFVIGGAQIYKAAVERKETKRILLTRILSDFECDTFFPVMFGEDGQADGWVRRSKEELDGWVGESVPEGVQVEGEGEGTRYIFEMWERSER